MRWVLLCAAALLAACGKSSGAEPCSEWAMQARAEKIQCLIHADLQAIEKRLQPPQAPKVVPPKCPEYDPDEVCDGECEAARGAAAEYRRKFDGMCATSKGMCYEMQSLGHWRDTDCEEVCLFFGDGPAERGGKP